MIDFRCSSVPCTVTLNAPLPPIASNVTIDGGTFGHIVIDGANSYRAFFVDSGTVAFRNLQIQNVLAQGGNGNGGAYGGGGGAGLGAGLFVNQASAVVTLTSVRFLNPSVVGGNGGAGSGDTGAGAGGGGLRYAGGQNIVGEYAGGGGGLLGVGGDSYSYGIGSRAGDGGAGGGGGGGGNSHLSGLEYSAGGDSYVVSDDAGGQAGSDFDGGTAGFGGGGGGAAWARFTGENGNNGGNGGKGGFGGGGGAAGSGGSTRSPGSGGAGGPGGGAAAGCAVFVNAGSLTVTNSSASNCTATGGQGASGGTNGGADQSRLFSFTGSIDGGPVSGPSAELDPISTSVHDLTYPSMLTYSQPLSVAATVVAAGSSGTPSGTIALLEGTTQLTSPAAIDASGGFTLEYGGLAAGTHTLTLQFTSANPAYADYSQTIAVTMNPPITTSFGNLTYPATPTYGVAASVTGSVTAASSAGGALTGTVSLLENGKPIAGSGSIDSSGSFHLNCSILAVGSHTITVQFASGNPAYASDSTTIQITVGPAALAVTADNASKAYGAALPVFTAHYTGFVNGDGTGVVSGSPSFNTAATQSSPVGTYNIVPVVGGLTAANYSFTPVNGTLTVSKAATSTALIGTSGSLVATVAVTPPGAGAPTGSVQFLQGSAVLGTSPLVGTSATAGFTPPLGNIVAVYSGDANFAGSTSPAVTIYPPAATTLSLGGSPNPSALGQAVTITASIAISGGAPNAAAPAGTVQLFDNGKPLGSATVSGGEASYTAAALGGGRHLITAQ